MLDESTIVELVRTLRRYERVLPCAALVLTDEALGSAERELGITFPTDYVRFVAALDGMALPDWQLYRPVPPAADELDRYDIVKQNHWLRAERGVPADLVAFRGDGLGDEYCFDLAQRDAGWHIFHWIHDAPDEDRPEPDARSFGEWIEQHIEDLPDVHR